MDMQKRKVIGTLSLAHMINDMYQNFIPQLLPFLLATRGYTLTQGASLVAAFTMTSSLSQPIFGYLVDLKGQRWLVHVGTLWMSVLLAATGYVASFPMLILLASLAGMGTAAFHPQAASMVGEVSGKRKGFILAFFIAFGNAGGAISPLILLPFFDCFGLSATWMIIVPGLLAAALLYLYAPRIVAKKKDAPSLVKTLSMLKKMLPSLGILLLVVALRSMTQTGVNTLMPLYLLSLHFSAANTGYLMFFTLITGAFGGIVGGYLSDRFGRKPLIVISLFAASLCFYGFYLSSGFISYILLALGALSIYATSSVTVAASQELIPENKALASGLSLGFSIGIGGLAVTPLGRYADVYGLSSGLLLIFILPALAALFGTFIKEKSKAVVETRTFG